MNNIKTGMCKYTIMYDISTSIYFSLGIPHLRDNVPFSTVCVG